jgi:hypothetical protein
MTSNTDFCGNPIYNSTANGTEFTMGAIGQAIHDADEWRAIQSHFFAWAVAGVFAFAAIFLSIYLIFQHFRHYHKPQHQRHITRILCMVPVYSLTSWLTFRYFRYVVYFEFVRGLFESFVIFEFFHLLLKYLGESEEEQKRVLKNKAARKLPYPCCLFTCNPAGPHFINDCKIIVMQYAIIRQVTTILGIVMQSIGIYCPESLSYRHGRLYLTLLNVGSTAVAMYGMVLLYLTVRKDIAEYKPITKFLSVKFVLFMTFWQTLILAILSHEGFIPKSRYWSPDDVTVGLQSFLICVEMFIAAMWHSRVECFGYQDFVNEHHKHNTSILESMKDAFDPSGTLKEWASGVLHLFRRCFGRAAAHHNYDDEAMVPLHG